VKLHYKNVNIAWSNKVIEFSSQFSEKEKSANQILGKPNVLPTGGPSSCAWTFKAKGKDKLAKPAFIKVSFEKPMKVKQVAVAESYNPGAIEKIVLYGANKEEKVVYSNSPSSQNLVFRMLHVFFDATAFDVTEGAIYLLPEKVPGWNEIDAFGIGDSWDSIKAEINLVPNQVFTSKKESLGASINTEFDEIAPMISPDGKIIYFDRKNSPENIGGEEDEDDIWVATLNENQEWSSAKNIGIPLNNADNTFVQSITPDGNTLLLGNVYEKNGMTNGVSLSNKEKIGWGMPIKQDIDGFKNLNRSANYFLTNDKRFLLMAIETSSSFGGLDLYVSTRISDNKWTAPKNLGNVINTIANDYSPFLAADGVTLYYSTSGLSGYGKEDIFMTRRLDDSWEKWTDPQNMGPAINTKESDSKYTIPASGEYAYFSSTDGSIGKNDIFKIKLPVTAKPKPVVLIRGIVKNDKTNMPISAEIIYETLPDGREIGRARSDPNTGEYTIILPAGYNYSFNAIADDFIGVSKNIDLKDITEYKEINQQELRLMPVMVGTVVVMNNIFFEFAKSKLKPESFPELDRVYKFLTEEKSMEIEISGHTDNIGSDQTNNKLSKERAQSCADYLIGKGIETSRISVAGYGKNRPVDFNTTDEGRAKNRRVEFTILKK
jgi:outer membrane protein OmpA-like peptidoglycan-associated protein